eukprot:1393344-Amorphochlora_amoeboformis.AAC.1
MEKNTLGRHVCILDFRVCQPTTANLPRSPSTPPAAKTVVGGERIVEKEGRIRRLKGLNAPSRGIGRIDAQRGGALQHRAHIVNGERQNKLVDGGGESSSSTFLLFFLLILWWCGDFLGGANNPLSDAFPPRLSCWRRRLRRDSADNLLP